MMEDEKIKEMLGSSDIPTVRLGIEMLRELNLGRAFEILVSVDLVCPVKNDLFIKSAILHLIFGSPMADVGWVSVLEEYTASNYDQREISRSTGNELWIHLGGRQQGKTATMKYIQEIMF